MTVLCSPIPGSEVDGIDGQPDHLGDFIEDTAASVSNVPLADMTIVLQEAESVHGLMPQLTGYDWRKLSRAAEREKAVLEKSKQAAIEKYGAVMVAAAERWIGDRFPPGMSIDPYGSLIGYYRWAYHQAVKTRKEVKPPKSVVGDPAPRLGAGAGLHAESHRTPSRCALEAVRGRVPTGGVARVTRRHSRVSWVVCVKQQKRE
jgi:hypothetical protein